MPLTSQHRTLGNVRAHICSAAAFCLFATATAAVLRSQSASPNVSGKWIGTLDIASPDGTFRHDTAFFALKQDGSKLSGTAGGTEHEQTEITDASVTGQEVHFTVNVRPGMSVLFNLHLEGDRLKGEATGTMAEGGKQIRIDTARIKPESARKAPESEDLFNEISRMDTLLFTAFNARDFAALETFFAKDLEFYHDKGGLTLYSKNMESFKAQFASEGIVRRELVEGTLEVYPIAGFGAVELGVHRFYTTEEGKPERVTATAKFVHLWQKKDGEWKICRVISYDHR